MSVEIDSRAENLNRILGAAVAEVGVETVGPEDTGLDEEATSASSENEMGARAGLGVGTGVGAGAGVGGAGAGAGADSLVMWPVDGTGIAGLELEVAFETGFTGISTGSVFRVTVGCPFATPLATGALFVDVLSVRLASRAAASKFDPILDKILRSIVAGVGVEVAPEYTGTGVPLDGVEPSPAVLSFLPPFAGTFVTPELLATLKLARSADAAEVSLCGYDTVESGELEKEPLRDPGTSVDDRLTLIDS